MERRLPHREKPYSRQQIQHFRAYAVMGESLAAELPIYPAVRDELNTLLHETPMSCRTIVVQHLLDPEKLIREVANNPLVRAFESTTFYNAADATVLERIRNLSNTGDIIPEDAIANFREWVDHRAPLIAKGLQACIRDSGVIPRLTPEQILQKRSEGMRRHVRENPEEFARHQEKMTKRAQELSHPTVYTDEIRAQMQRWYDKGLDYDTVAQLLKAHGIDTTPQALHGVTVRHSDIQYTPEQTRREQAVRFSEAVQDIYSATGSAKKTSEILQKLGYTKDKIKWYLQQLGLRDRICWGESVQINGTQQKLEDVVVEFSAKKYPTIREEHAGFVENLRQHGIETPISYSAYKTARDRVLGHRKK